MTNRPISSFLYVVLLISLISACGGKIAKTGVGSVMDVNDGGAFTFSYADGRQSWKKFGRDSLKKDIIIAKKNRLKTARFVETEKGGTLTFPDGNTILYYDYQ